VLGIDITRSPHPKALLLFSPLISGGVFLIGAAYFHPEFAERFFASKLDSSLRMVVLFIVSYATGMMLSAAVVFPFTILTYVFSYFGTIVVIAVVRFRSKTAIHPSSRSAFRRAASVLLGKATAPMSPGSTATALVNRLVAYFVGASTNQTAEPPQKLISDETQLKVEAMKILALDVEEQWNDIHQGLYQLQIKTHNPADILVGIEPILSVAAAVIVWRWLSFPVPVAFYYAAIVIFVYMGLTLLIGGMGHGLNYMNGSTLHSFLVERLLDRDKGGKVGDSPP
jgi:hypothetical protein